MKTPFEKSWEELQKNLPPTEFPGLPTPNEMDRIHQTAKELAIMVTKKGKLAQELKLLIEEHKDDKEMLHILMDNALLRYIDDGEVTEVFKSAQVRY